MGESEIKTAYNIGNCCTTSAKKWWKNPYYAIFYGSLSWLKNILSDMKVHPARERKNC